MKYKRVKKTVPWCYTCNQEIWGYGSEIISYQCKCGEWKFDSEEYEYKLCPAKPATQQNK